MKQLTCAKWLSDPTRVSMCVASLLLMATATSRGAITEEFTNLDVYNEAVGVHSVITFTEMPVDTTLTDQYNWLGVTFTGGNDNTHSSSSYVSDGIGAVGNGRIDISFSSAMTHIGAEFPGALRIELYDGDTLLATSIDFAGHGSGFFGGVTATPFNRVVLIDWFDDTVYVDNLHFGAIPEPATLSIFALSGTALLRRR